HLPRPGWARSAPKQGSALLLKSDRGVAVFGSPFVPPLLFPPKCFVLGSSRFAVFNTFLREKKALFAEMRSAGFRRRSVCCRGVGFAYLRPTTRFTGKFRVLVTPALGLWLITRPGRFERARRTVPTLQCALRIRVRARPRVSPITLGTRQRTVGGGGGGG